MQAVDIDNVIDRAIIKALEYIKSQPIPGRGLTAGGIKNIIKEKFSINDDEDVQARIRVLYEREILVEVKPSQPRKDTKRIYSLNEDIAFNYVCGLLPKEGGSKEIPLEVRRKHTVELQEAIKQWIEHFPMPSADYPFDQASRYQDDVHRSESHALFPDLECHFSAMGIGVWKAWRRYKEDLLRLQVKKKELLVIIKNVIAKCFKGIPMKFDEECDINNCECHLLPRIFYYLVIDLSGRVPDQEAYENYVRCMANIRENTMIEERSGSIIWRLKESDDLIIVPKEKHDALEKGIAELLNILNSIEHIDLQKKDQEIIRDVEKLKANREAMMKELEEILHFYVFSGECKYLSGF